MMIKIEYDRYLSLSNDVNDPNKPRYKFTVKIDR